MNRLTVVMYHYVRNLEDSRYPEIKGLELDLFIKQIEFFIKNYNIVTMEDVIDCEKGKKQLPEKSLLLTFDDGYHEHFTNVYPILKCYGVQGSFFIPAKAILEHTLLDVNKIHFILASLVDSTELVLDLKNDIIKNKEKFGLKDFNSYFNEYATSNRFDKKEVGESNVSFSNSNKSVFLTNDLSHKFVKESKVGNKLVTKVSWNRLGVPFNSSTSCSLPLIPVSIVCKSSQGLRIASATFCSTKSSQDLRTFSKSSAGTSKQK